MPDTVSPLTVIPSLDRFDNGQSRFQLVPFHGAADFDRLFAAEQEGGIDAEFRLFLDAQLEAHDVFVDFAPGTGVVVLTAATHEQRPRVIVCDDEVDTAHVAALNAQINECAIDAEPRGALRSMVATGSLFASDASEGRLFVQVACADLLAGGLEADLLAAAPGFTALLVRDAHRLSARQQRALRRDLTRAGLVLHELVETSAGPSLVPYAHDRSGNDIMPAALFALAGDHTPVRVDAQAAAPGTTTFNFIAQHCRTGYGVTGANLLAALARLDADVAFFPLGAVDRSVGSPLDRGGYLERYLDRQADFDEWAPSVRMSQEFDLALHVGRGPRIGFPIFETDRFSPRERHHLQHHEHLVVCSAWARDVIRSNGIDVPITIVPLGVDRSIFHEQVQADAPSSDTLFVQVGKIEPRKGQLDLLQAFEAAFTPQDAVRLRLYCHNAFLGAEAVEQLLAPFRRSPMAARIELITTPLPTQHDVARAMMAADCGVFCSRAEGWNLEALEMLSLGKPVIATDYSGHTEFLSAENAYLVPVTSREVYGVGSWGGFGAAEKDALVAHLRTVHAARRTGTLARNHAGIATAKQFSWDAAARQLLSAVDAATRG